MEHFWEGFTKAASALKVIGGGALGGLVAGVGAGASLEGLNRYHQKKYREKLRNRRKKQ